MTLDEVGSGHRPRRQLERTRGSLRPATTVVIVAILAATGIVGLSALAGTAGAANGTTIIDDCTVIDEPGSYRLGGNITDVNSSQLFGSSFQSNSDACIDIRSSDVTLDGNGSLLDWDHTGNTVEQRGVYVNGTGDRRSNVTVRNLEVTDWPRGVSSFNASGLLVEDTTVRTRNASDTRGFSGLYPRATTDSTFRRITFEDYGIAIRSEGSDFATSNRNNRYADNVVRRSGAINIGPDSENVTVTDNELRYDLDTGSFTNFVTADGGTVSENLIVGSGTLALEGSNLTVERNAIRNASGSGEYGIDVEGDGFSIRNNTVANRTRGLQIKGSDHVLRDNELRNNTENFHLVRQYTDVRTRLYSDLVSLDIDTSNTADGDPIYVFQEETDTTFTGSDVGYLAYVNSSGVTVRDVTLTNNTDGLFLANVTDATVEGSTLAENAIGVEMAGGDDVTIRRSRVANNTETGVVGFPAGTGPSNVTVLNNTVAGNEIRGIELGGLDLTIADNGISGNGDGIEITGDRATIRGNDVSDNRDRGIRVTADDVTVRDNLVTGNGGEGIFFDFSRDNQYEAVGNNVSDNGEAGIVTESTGGELLDNTLLDNADAGIHVRSQGSAVVRNNTARDNEYGIRLYRFESGRFEPERPVDDNVVADNVLTGNQRGISVGTRSGNNTLRNNTATGNGVGIYLENVGGHRITENNVSANAVDGVHYEDYTGPSIIDTRIANNTALGNGDDGIELEDAEADESDGPFTIRDNEVRRNDHIGIVIERADGVVVADNGRVSDNGGAGIDVENSANVTVRNHTVAGNGVGFLALSSDFTVADLNASGNDGDGISIDDVADLSLGADVTASDNGGSGIDIEDGRDVRVRAVPANANGGDGIELVDTEDALIRNVTTTDNYAAGIAVVDDDFAQEENVTVRNVTVQHNGIGIDVEGVERTTIADSTITDGNASAASAAADVDVPADDPEDRIRVNGSGVVLESASNATLHDNTVTDNDGKGIVATLSAGGSRLADNDVTDNGGNGIAFVETSGPSTIANNVVSDNGGLELYDTISIGPNGENGVYLESASNVTVRNNTIERNEGHGVRINDDSNDNRIAENDIATHTSANETGHGVFILGRGVDFGFPSSNTVVDNEITDNDYGVSMFHDADTVVRGNDVLRNGIGVRFGSDTEPISARETTECTDDGVLAFNNQFAGSTGGTVVDNEIRTDGTALKIITHPSRTTTCDGATTDVSYDDPTVEGYLIANNYLEGAEPINATNSRLDYPTGETYDSSFNGTNAWNVSKTVAGNVLGGPYRAGNYWATPDGTGFSRTCTDADGDGICDSPRSIATNNVDRLPLAADQPAFFDVAIGATTSPGTSGDAVDVTATITNTGNATATETIDLTVNGTVAGSVSRTLDPGASTTETFTWDTTGISPGTYSATVASGTDSASVPVTIDPNVSVRIDATNAPITETETLTVDATLRNNREEAVTETIELLDVDGAVVDSRDVSLGAGESASISLSWTTNAGDEGTAEVTVRSDGDAARRTVTIRNGSITACTDITRPGRYRLDGNLTLDGDECLTIESSGVSIDGQGHEIIGSGAGTGVLIDVAAGATADIALNNLTVRDASDAVRVPVPDEGSVSGISLTGVTGESISGDGLHSEIGENGTVAGLSVHDGAFETGGSGIVLDADDDDVVVRDVAVTGTTLNASDTALEAEYAGADTTLAAARIADNRIRSDSGSGVRLVGSDDRTTTRDVYIGGNDVRSGEHAVHLEHDYDDLTVESLRVSDNHLETDGSTGVLLEADDSGLSVTGTSIRNNTIASGAVGVELEFDGGFDGATYETTVADNEIRGFGETGVELDGVLLDATTDVGLLNNTIHNESGIVTGIDIDTDEGDSPAGVPLEVRENSIRTGGDAVLIASAAERVDLIEVSDNALVALGLGVNNEASDAGTPVNATENYWNASDGPGSAGPYEDPLTGALADGNGSAVSNGSSASLANVRFDPFLTTDPTDSGDSEGSAVFDATVDATNAPIEEGESLTVDATVENTGGATATRTVSLSLGGVERDSMAVTLAPGESTTVTLSWTTGSGDAGEYTAAVTTDDATDSTTVTVTEPIALPPSVQPVDDCTNITAPGRYALTEDVSGTGTCIDVRADDVVLDGNGHVIQGVDANNGTGIRAGYRRAGSNVTLRNVTVRGWDAGIEFRGIDDGRIVGAEAVDNGVGVRVGTAQVNVDPLDPRRMILASANVELRENVVERNNGSGIRLDRVTNGTIAGNRAIDNNGSGIVLLASEGNDVSNNTLTANDDSGLEITGRQITIEERETANRRGEPIPDPDSNDSIVANNSVTNNGQGMRLVSAPNSTVRNNTVRGNDDAGVFVTGGPLLGAASNLTVADNAVAANNGSGIVLFGPGSLPVFDNGVTNNTASANNGSGILLVGADGNLVRDNRVTANDESGVTLLATAVDNELRNNTAARNDRSGVFLSTAVDAVITNNTATRNGEDGFLVLASGETLTGNNATANGRHGFALGAGNVTLSGATANANGRDGVVVRAANATVEDSVASGNDRNGIHLRGSAHGDITDNVANGNDRHGILVNLSATDNELAGNVANGNGESGIALSGVPTATPENNSLTDTVARNNGAWAIAIRGATGTVVEDMNVGASTEPDTTLSFEAENVAVGASEAPPANPDNESIGRYFDAEATGAGAFLDVELRYADGDVGGLDEGSFTIQRYDGTGWTVVESTPSPSENVVAANVTDFSTFGVFGTEGDGSDDGDSGDAPTIAPGQPGFGPALAAIALLLAFAGVALRRRGA
jgi:parallel beta-helix repeat protein